MRTPLPTRIAAVLVAVGVPSCAQIIGLDQYHDGICTPGDTRSDDCPYTGAEGTKDVGICRAGQRTCAEDGQSWSACTNEVKPLSHEDCSTPDDDNCDGQVNEASAGCCTPGDKVACYTGPDGTADVGLCKSGSQTCGSTGTIEGTCTGDVKPQQERCDAPEDENCDSYDCVEWAEMLGDAADQNVQAVAVDVTGNIFVTGELHGSLSLGNGMALQAAGGGDAFVLKLDAAGKPVWGKVFGDAARQTGTALAVDSSGNVIVGATTGSAFTSGATSFAPGLLVVKLNGGTGEIIWGKSMGGLCPTLDDAHVAGVALTTGNDVAIAGAFCSSIDFGGGPVSSVNGKQDAFAALLHSGDGAASWGKNFNDPAVSTAVSHANGVAVGVDGNVVVTGGFEATIRIGTAMVAPSAGGTDAFLAEFGPSGSAVSLHRYGSTGDQEAMAIRIDSTGNFFLAGRFKESIDLGGGPLAGDHDQPSVFLAKLARQTDFTHAYEWAKVFGAPTALAIPANMALHSSGDIILTGIFLGDIDLGAGTLSSGTNIDIFLAKLDGTGKARWSRRFDDPLLTGSTSPFAVGFAAVLPSGESVLVGTTPSAIDFGTGKLTPAGGTDVFVAKFGL